MGFESGNKLSNGRPKGSPNKFTDKVRSNLSKLTDQKLSDLQDALEEVRSESPAKYVELYLKMLEYTMPKLRAIDNKIDIAENAIEKIVVELKTRDNEPRA
jgi:hypothetical protein